MADDSYTTIALQIHGLVENVPTNVSGNNLLALIDRSRQTIKAYSGLDPGSPYVSDRFKPAIMALTLGQVWSVKATEGTDKSIHVGDFSVNAGGGENSASASASYYEKEAQRELGLLGRGARYGRTY
jgi:hypothetical protein